MAIDFQAPVRCPSCKHLEAHGWTEGERLCAEVETQECYAYELRAGDVIMCATGRYELAHVYESVDRVCVRFTNGNRNHFDPNRLLTIEAN